MTDKKCLDMDIEKVKKDLYEELNKLTLEELKENENNLKLKAKAILNMHSK